MLGVKRLMFPNMVIWHIKLKGMISRAGHNIKFYPMAKLMTLVGLKGQIPLNFFESVAICDGAPSTAHSR